MGPCPEFSDSSLMDILDRRVRILYKLLFYINKEVGPIFNVVARFV
jgi:hypothetical protein